MSIKANCALVLVLVISSTLAIAQQGKKLPARPALQAVATDGAPKAAGPYSQAIKAGEFVYAAGQTGRDPATNKLVDGDITAQADRALKNLSAVLAAAGSGMDRVVKATVYLKNMSDFAKL